MEVIARRERVKDRLRLYGVELARKDADVLMLALAFILGRRFLTDYWTTYRLPFGKPRITYPPGVLNPLDHWQTLEHELFHVEQFAPWYGPALVALLVALF